MLPDHCNLEQVSNEEKEKKEKEIEDVSMENIEVASVGSSWHQQNQWAQDHIYSKQIYKVGTKESINELLGKVECIPPKTELGLFLRPEVTVIGPYGYYCCEAQYTSLCNLGRGAYGVVEKVIDNVSRRTIAKKQISRENLRKIEVEILLHSDCKHIPELFGLNIVNDIVGIWMEFVEFIWDKLAPVGNEVASDYLGQLIDGLVYLHRQNIMHMDIKPQNLGITSRRIVKMLDFGSANRVTDVQCHGCGVTPEYMAPECFDSSTNINEKVDIWAAALSVLYLLTGRHPWSERNATNDRFKKVKSKLTDATPEYVLREHSVSDISQHQWLRRVLLYMLQIQPERRCSANLASIFIGERGNDQALSQNQLWLQYLCSVDTELQENTAAVRVTTEQEVIISQLLQHVVGYRQMEHQTGMQNLEYLQNQVCFIQAQQQQQQPHYSQMPQQVPAVPLHVDPMLIQHLVQERINQLAAAQQAQRPCTHGNPNCHVTIPDFTELFPRDSNESD